MDSPIQPEGTAPVVLVGPQPSERAYDEAEFTKRLTDEYKILQDKIDKIGAFRFTIKGWSVTAVIAASAAGGASKSLLTVVTLSTGLIVMLGFFFWLEHEQVSLSRLFGDRAGRLEDAFRRVDRGKGKELKMHFLVPYTAHEVVLAKHRQAIQKSNSPQPGDANANSWAAQWRVFKQAHIWFYIVLMGLALAPLAPHHHAIAEHWREWTTKSTQKVSPIPISTPNTELHK